LDDVIIKIKGMMCGHCEKTVTEAAKSVKGVTKASAYHKKGEAKVVDKVIEKVVDKAGEIKKTPITIKITGMTCASCAQNIEKALNKIDGVVKASVNFSFEKAAVEYDSSKVTAEELENTITSLGYGVAKSEVTLKVEMMHCASCALNIEKALKKIQGIKSVNVSFPLERAKISYDH